MAEIKLLGLDPGLRITGWGVLAVDGNRLRHIADGVVAVAASVEAAFGCVHQYKYLEIFGNIVYRVKISLCFQGTGCGDGEATKVAATTIMEDADIEDWEKGQNYSLRLIRAIKMGCEAEPMLNAWYDSKENGLRVHRKIDLVCAARSGLRRRAAWRLDSRRL